MKDFEYIQRIIEYSKKIQSFIKLTPSLEEFKRQEIVFDAVSFNLEQIGETAKKITTSTKLKFQQIDWRSIVGLRNIISHDYEGINVEIIYEIALQDIPHLQHQLEIMSSII